MENIDIEACRKAGVEVVRSQASTASAEAEFAVGALAEPVAARAGGGQRRSQGRSRAGLLDRSVVLGLTPAAQVLAQLLQAFGARVVGYDPALHPERFATWARWGIEAAEPQPS